MAHVNMVSGCIEQYVGVDKEGYNEYKILYNPKFDTPDKLHLAIEHIRKEDRQRAMKKINDLGKDFDF